MVVSNKQQYVPLCDPISYQDPRPLPDTKETFYIGPYFCICPLNSGKVDYDDLTELHYVHLCHSSRKIRIFSNLVILGDLFCPPDPQM